MDNTQERQLKEDTARHLECIQEEAIELMNYIDTNTMPDPDPLTDDYMYCFDDGCFDVIAWINNECLEANSRELLLATGGPAYGVVMIQNHPYFWFQDWYTSKQVVALDGDAATFYNMIFETLEELDC